MLKFKSLTMVVGLVLATALVGAQAKPQFKKVKEQISFSTDVKVGSTVLKSGKYEVASTDEGLSFRRMVQDATYPSQWNYDMRVQPVLVKASATILEAKSRGTEMDLPVDSTGVAVLKTITLEDTNVKFTIAQ